MYPFKDHVDFVRNAWYVAAWSSGVGGTPSANRFLDEPVVLYRTGSGEVVALADRCIHRGYPLSLGAVDGERIVCGYHGFTYDSDGRCVAIPSQARVPPAYAVRRYPTRERGGAVWIWMGEDAAADDALLPDVSELGLVNAQFHMSIGGTIRFRCRSELIHENLQFCPSTYPLPSPTPY